MRPPPPWLEASGVQALHVFDVLARVSGGVFGRPTLANQDAGCSDRGDSQYSNSELVPDSRLLVGV